MRVCKNNYSDEVNNVPRKFGVTLPTMKNTFFVAVNYGLKTIIEENGDKIITLIPEFD